MHFCYKNFLKMLNFSQKAFSSRQFLITFPSASLTATCMPGHFMMHVIPRKKFACKPPPLAKNESENRLENTNYNPTHFE